MTIRRGEEWGHPVDRPRELRTLTGDAELAAAIPTSDPVSVSAGDLHRAVGSPSPRPTMQLVHIDLLHVTADGRALSAVAHVVARRSWWRGAVVMVMNTDHLGEWNVAPRGHPNDGRFDVVEIDPTMTLRERWQVRQRLPQGTHLPHPRISTRMPTGASWHFDRPLDLWVDGVESGRVTELAVRIEADAFELHI